MPVKLFSPAVCLFIKTLAFLSGCQIFCLAIFSSSCLHVSPYVFYEAIHLFFFPSVFVFVWPSIPLSSSPSAHFHFYTAVSPPFRLSVRCPSLSERLSLYLSVRLSLCSSVHSICLSVCSSFRLSSYPSVCLSICQVCPSVGLSSRPPVRLSFCPSVRLYVSPSVLQPAVRSSVCRFVSVLKAFL